MPRSDHRLVHAKCPKCGAVFEWAWQPSLVHAGSSKYMKCPACGKRAWIQTDVRDEITWPKEDAPSENSR
ncbi:MAG TPA: hypothetical protein VMS79_00360 [Methanomassiliicoccales archaeon]|nr:hypothetical protein [Methanomassiliicoccales archaeon]